MGLYELLFKRQLTKLIPRLASSATKIFADRAALTSAGMIPTGKSIVILMVVNARKLYSICFHLKRLQGEKEEEKEERVEVDIGIGIIPSNFVID